MFSSMNLLLISSYIYVSMTLSRRHYLIEIEDKGHVDLHSLDGLQTEVLPIYTGGDDGMDYATHSCNGEALVCGYMNKIEEQTIQEDSCHFQ